MSFVGPRSDTGGHQCAAEGCTIMVPTYLLMCYAHWRRVPQALRLELSLAWNRGNPGSDYLQARQACIDAVKR